MIPVMRKHYTDIRRKITENVKVTDSYHAAKNFPVTNSAETKWSQKLNITDSFKTMNADHSKLCWIP